VATRQQLDDLIHARGFDLQSTLLTVAGFVDQWFVEEPSGRVVTQTSNHHVVPDRQHTHNPGELSVFGEERQPMLNGIGGRVKLDLLAFDDDFASVDFLNPKDTL